MPSTFAAINTNDAGAGSLRQAILDSNAHQGLNTIIFDIPPGGVQTIRPTSALPTITNPVVIDGTYQPGFAGTPLIELNGSDAGPNANGLTIDAGNCTVRGLVVDGFTFGTGIVLESNGGNRIVGNYIGTDPTGTLRRGYAMAGIDIFSGVGNVIGGTTAADRNLISGNDHRGLYIAGPNTVVQGDYIGTDATGTHALANAEGIAIFGAPFTTIGGTAPGAGNVISGNLLQGTGGAVDFTSSSNGLVQGNLIGTDVTGTLALSNGSGVSLFSHSDHATIGGTVPEARNVIAANFGGGNGSGVAITASGDAVVEGNDIGVDITGQHGLANGIGVSLSGSELDAPNTIGGTAAGAGNVISGNGFGIDMDGVADIVQGNRIGTDVAGTVAVGNGTGVFVRTSAGVRIGGTDPAARNLISGNSTVGINLSGGSATIQGNWIGTDVTGSRALGNGAGITLPPAGFDNNNRIGGTEPGAGNVISGNRGDGLFLNGVTGNMVQGNLIGTNAAGTAALGNSGNGVALQGGSQDNTIGGTLASAANVISGNGGEGIRVYDDSSHTRHNFILSNFIGTNAAGTAAIGNHNSGIFIPFAQDNVISGNLVSGNLGFAGIAVCAHSPCGGLTSNSGNASGNVVIGNQVGTDVNGTVAVANAGYGVSIDGVSGTGIVVGGTTPDARNLISGNSSAGVEFFNNATATVVEGNYIGTNASGAAPLPNRGDGIRLDGASGNTIGGTAAGAGNLISANTFHGIDILAGSGNLILGNLIGTDVTGGRGLGNEESGVVILGSNNTVGGSSAQARNVISGNSVAGVGIGTPGTGNMVLGNFVGTDITGTRALGNLNGISVSAPSNTIGGTLPGAGNLVSGNTYDGISITITNQGTNNIVQGNFVGTDVTGTLRLGNLFGISITGNGNTVGGTAPGAGNLVSGNGQRGFDIFGQNNLFQGNFVGTDVSGTAAIPNGDGFYLTGSGNIIGGTAPGAGNLISGNTNGIYFQLSGHNLVQGNRVGTDVSGTMRLGNTYGLVVAGSDNTIGGTSPAAGNLISGNQLGGIFIGEFGDRTVVQGNWIGTDPSATLALGNGMDGVSIYRGSNNTIGGTTPGAANVIADNGANGVQIDLSNGNRLTRNVIFGHDHGLGIALGITGNHQQEAPTLTSAVFDGEFTTITGTLTSAPTTTFTIELFVNSVCNPSGYGEGEQFFASFTVATDANGNAAFTLSLPIEVDVGKFMSATATDSGNNTSQFAACVEVEGPGTPGIIAFVAGDISAEAAFAAQVGFQAPGGGLVDHPQRPVAKSGSEAPAAGSSSGLDFPATWNRRRDPHPAAFLPDDPFLPSLGPDVDRVLLAAF
jgi:hypothetical protein